MVWSAPDVSPSRPLRSAIRSHYSCSGGSSGGTGDAAELAPSQGLWERAPSFACGAVTAFILQWLTRSLWPGGKNCVELRHMAEALHAQVDATRGLLSECQGERLLSVASQPPTGTAARTSSTETTTVPAPLVPVVHVVDIAAAHVSVPPSGAPFHTTMAAPSEVSEEAATGRFWSGGLLLLDTGLVYFCVAHMLSPGARTALEARAARALACWRGVRDDRGIGPEAKAAPQSPNNDGAPPLPPLTPIDPSGGAVMVQRRAHPKLNLRRKDPDLEAKRRLVNAGLASASFLGVLALRAVVNAVESAGFRFLEHLLIYAIVTVRVCLVALLILF